MYGSGGGGGGGGSQDKKIISVNKHVSNDFKSEARPFTIDVNHYFLLPPSLILVKQLYCSSLV